MLVQPETKASRGTRSPPVPPRLMSSTAQIQFAAEFMTFLATAAGLALVLLRGELVTSRRWSRSMLGVGFAAIATVAFLRGSLTVVAGDDGWVLVRLAGTLVALTGSMRWVGGRGSRPVFWTGLVLVAVSALFEQDAAPSDSLTARGTVGSMLLAFGALGIGYATLSVSRRSVAARVAASAAGVLLLLVLVLSLALSAVLSDNVRREAVARLASRAGTEAALVDAEASDAVLAARLASQSLARAADSTLRTELLSLADSPRRSGIIDGALAELSTRFLAGTPLVYLSPAGTVLAATGLDPAVFAPLAGTAAVREAVTTNNEVASVAAVAGRPLALGVAPISAAGGRQIGVVVAAAVLDRSYLAIRAADDRDLALALVTRTEMLARVGTMPQTDRVNVLVRDVLDEDRLDASATERRRFVVAKPVRGGDNQPVMALLASTPTTAVDAISEDLFRALFRIALGGTFLALLLAALVGERIGAGLRRLTLAAERIERGDFSTRAGIVSDDEVGVLGATFDLMAESIEAQTGELRDAAETQARLRNRVEAILEGMGEALVAVDAHGLVTDINRAAEDLLGVVAAGTVGHPAEEVLRMVTADGDDLTPRFAKPMARYWSAVGTVEPVSGSEPVPVGVVAASLRGPAGELSGGVFVLRDLRPEREVENMKTEFLAHIGHELRTPLAGIIGFTEILARRSMPPARAQAIHADILRSAHRLQKVVEMLEFFASSGAGRITLHPEKLDLRGTFDEAIARWNAPSSPVRITRRVARDVPSVDADRRWILRSLDELLENAVKFSPEGGRISVTATAARRGGVRGVEISVLDRGIGMTDEQQARAFADFVQGDGSDTRRFGGLGLGLSMVKRVAEAHGGDVWCESTPGKGSKFSIFLPGRSNKKAR